MIKAKVAKLKLNRQKIKVFGSEITGTILVLVGMIIFIIQPDIYMQAFSGGLKIFVLNVLPALFPFFFFNKLLTSFGFASKLGKLLSRPMKKLYRTPAVSGYVFTMSLLSGYPIGAKLTADLYSSNFISKNDALAMTAFCSTSGPLFILGTVSGFFDNYKFALILLLTNYLSAFLNGFIYRNKKSDNNDYIPQISVDKAMGSVIYDSIISILIVGGFIAIFNMIADMVSNLGISAFVGNIFDKTFSFVPSGTGYAVFVGLIEMTRGSLLLSDFGTNTLTACLTSFILSFGGLGIAMQSITFLQKCNVSTFDYLLRKFSQSVIATVLAIPLSLVML